MSEQVPIRVSAAEVIAGAEVPIGEPRIRTISRGAVDMLLGGSTALAERRQRALEAADDARGIADYEPIIGVAIETATRVRITDEVLAAVYAKPWASDEECLKAAFEAAGFEVEE